MRIKLKTEIINGEERACVSNICFQKVTIPPMPLTVSTLRWRAPPAEKICQNARTHIDGGGIGVCGEKKRMKMEKTNDQDVN